MANLRIATKNLVDGESLAASPPLETTLPESHLLDPMRSNAARTTSTADQMLTGELVVDADCGLVSNGNFEADVGGWINGGTGTRAQNTTEQYFGSACMELTAGSDNGVDHAYTPLEMPYFRAGTRLSLSFWIKAAPGSALKIRRWLFAVGGANPAAHLISVPLIDITTEWQRFTVNGDLDYDDRTGVSLYLGYQGSGQEIGDKLYIDGVQIHIGSQNPPFFPTVSMLAVWATNLTHQCQLRLSLSTDAAYGAGGGEIYSTGWVSHHDIGTFDNWPDNRRFCVIYFSGIDNAQSFRVDISDPNNPAGYMQIGELWIGDYAELGFNFEREPALRDGDNSRFQRSIGGGGYRSDVAVLPWREAQISLSDLTDAEAELLDSAQRNNSRFWIDMYPDEASAAKRRYGRMIGQLELIVPTVPLVTAFYRKRIKVVED